MSNTKFTANQQAAIAHAGHNILVSASAGSGKTTVLVERVIQKLIHGEDIDRLLIVTFTQAAAAEMRERIRAALAAKANETTDRTLRLHLRKQLAHIGSADISTLDAFCARVVRRFYYVINYDPAVRTLGDDNERLLLWQQAWERVRDQYYEDDDQDFLDLVSNFTTGRSDDGLTKLVFRLLTNAMASPDPLGWIDQVPALYDFPQTTAGLDHSPLLAENQPGNLRAQIVLTYQDLLQQYTQQVTGVAEIADLSKLYTFGMEETDTLADVLPVIQHGDFDGIRQGLLDAQNVLKNRFPVFTKRNTEESLLAVKDQVKAARDDIKAFVTELLTGPFLLTASDWLPIMAQAQKLTDKLTQVLHDFAEALTQTKKRRGIAEFADIELAALQILQTKTETGIQPKVFFAEKYHEIMVDEYQDTNPLQEAILTTIAAPHPGNMFMVGDIKQSIYGFRQADPTLFAKKYVQYGQADTSSERIVLAENFRSAKAVDDMVNYVFKQLMDTAVGDVVYDDNAQLQFGASYYPQETAEKTAVMLVPDEVPDEDATVNRIPLTGIAAQTAAVGAKIQSLVTQQTAIFDKQSGQLRPLQYSDIAIIVPTRGANLDILDGLDAFGVPVVMNDAKEYFQTTEITVMLNYLSVIDNPRQDIPLAGLLRSPIVGFTADELATIRIHHQAGPYYAAWQHFVADPAAPGQETLHQKAVALAHQIEQYRTLSKQVRIADLIWQIYLDTGFLDYAGGMPSGKQRQANLHALYERANDYENSGFKGIFNFIRFIHQVQENDQDLAMSPVTSTDDNAVTVMTIHGSKGLEFPVVFLLNAQHNFNRTDERGAAIALRNGGIGIKINDYHQHIAFATPQHYYAQTVLHQVSQSEELRKLYVALTRARQLLYVVGSIKNDAAAMVSKWASAVRTDTPLLAVTKRESASNFLDLIMPALLRLPAVNTVLDADGLVQTDQSLGEPAISVAVSPPTSAPQRAQSRKKSIQVEVSQFPELQDQSQRWRTTYRYTVATRTTAFQSVTEIKRQMDDPANDELTVSRAVAAHYTATPANRYAKDDEFSAPEFVTAQAKPMATAVGTATHLVFQSIDLYHPVTEAIVQDKIGKLVADGKLTAIVADQIDVAGIAAFYATDLGQQILAQPAAVQREVPFSLMLPPTRVFPGTKVADFPPDSDVLIHGIIDGYLAPLDGSDIILFDYKTDRLATLPNGAAKLRQEYAVQLQLYAAALTGMLHRPVAKRYLYAVLSGALIAVPPADF